MAHTDIIKDSDKCFEIDPITRVIRNASPTKTTIIQFDHNSERFTFTLPRFIEGHDMVECTKAEVHYLNIASSGGEQSAGVYAMTDMAISAEDDSMVTCSWLISQNATKHVGSLNFLIRLSCVAEDGTIEYVWNTEIFKGIMVSTGMFNSDVIVEQYADVLEQWKQELLASDSEVLNAAKAYTDERIGEINTLDCVVNPMKYKTLSLNQLNPENITDSKRGSTWRMVTDIKPYKPYIAFTMLSGALTTRTTPSGVVYKFYNASGGLVSNVISTTNQAPIEIPEGTDTLTVDVQLAWIGDEREPMIQFFDGNVEVDYNSYSYEAYSDVYSVGTIDLTQVKTSGDDTTNDSPTSCGAKTGIVWDWWISAHVTDVYGNVYIGYVDEGANHGVLCRKTDGTTHYKTLGKSRNNDDHNGCGVGVLSDGRIIAIAPRGHSANNERLIYIATEPYTVDCDFEDKSISLRMPPNTTYKTCYSQIFVDVVDGVEYITNFFRCNVNDGTTSEIQWACIKSTDGGNTWTLYRTLKNNDMYGLFVNTNDGGTKKRVFCYRNPVNTTNDIYTGFIDVVSGEIYGSDGSVVGLMTAVENGIDDGTNATAGSLINDSVPVCSDIWTPIVSATNKYRIRLLDVMKSESDEVYAIYAKSQDNSTYENYTYCLYANGTTIEIGESGMPFYMYSSYLPGAVFGSDANTIYYCKNTSGVQDGEHELHKVVIENNAASSDTVIAKSDKLLIRPLLYNGNSIALCTGVYNDVSVVGTTGNFTSWKLMPIFKELLP